MNTTFPSVNEKLNLVIQGSIDRYTKKRLRDIFAHAVFNKSDVQYDQVNQELSLKLRRHSAASKAKKKFLWLTIWDTSIKPTIPCMLIIKNIEAIEIHDGDPNNIQRQEVINGGVSINESNNEIYIGSFCQHENPYGIVIKVKSIYIVIRDI